MGGGAAAGRSALPAALTLLVHLLLVLAWVHGGRMSPAADGNTGPRLLLVPLLAPATPRPTPAERSTPRRVRKANRAPGGNAPPGALPPGTPVPAAPLPAPVVGGAPTAASADILARARQDAGRIDRDLRGGMLKLRPHPTGWARFQASAENAFIDRSHTETMDTYTAADGVVIYRFRQGNRVRCHMTGSVGPGVAGGYTGGAMLAGAGSAGGGGTAGTVDCPSGERPWARQ